MTSQPLRISTERSRRREALTRFHDYALRRFYGAVEIVGLSRLPPEGTPLIYACNHKGGLMDPILVLTYLPRRPAFLAKRPLFESFFIAWGVRVLDSIPVYRAADGDDPKAQNVKSFQMAQDWLKRGHAIAIFPEGASHSESRVIPLKSGLARLALDANLPDLQIVPVGIDYENREAFGKSVKLRIGEPILVSNVPPSENERERIRGLTNLVATALTGLFSQFGSGGYATQSLPLWSKLARLPIKILFAPLKLFSHWLSVRTAGSERDLVGTYKFLCMSFFGIPYLALVFLGVKAWFGLKIAALGALLLLFLSQLRVNPVIYR